MSRFPFVLAVAGVLFFLLASLNAVFRLFPADVKWSAESPPTLSHDHDEYLLGVGKADITGPVVEINFMGYADPGQLGSGVRQRLYSRAFVIGDVESPKDRFVYLVLDTQSGDTAVRHGILSALQDLGSEFAVYGQQNVAVTGTHSHSGPGAWLNYLLPQITSRGFHKPSYQAIVDGAVASIVAAHRALAVGRLNIGSTEILDANVNRSPYAYLANPAVERARYEHDVEKTMTILRFTHTQNHTEKDIGVLTWFPVHGTSMHGNNTLVTGDNKGVAAWLLEKSMDDPEFVAGFSQSNVGDTSPNIRGAYCESGDAIGQLCDFETSLCAGKTQPCHGRGPYFGRNDGGTASSFEIGRRQFEAARRLLDDKSAFFPIRGSAINSLHQFVDLSTYSFTLSNGTAVKTCPAALGFSFAAGTSDGPGAFDFKQGQPEDPHANPLWSAIGNRIAKPNRTQKACHGVKPILLDVGESSSPYDWSPNIVDLQLLRVGQLFIIVAPGEATTMAGRRWKDALETTAATTFPEFSRKPLDLPISVLGGPANTYSHYITTAEEYSVQRYEGASTLYGPHTLDAYIDLTVKSLVHLTSSHHRPVIPQLPPGPSPPILTNTSLSFITPVVVDRAPLFHSFGDVRSDVEPLYHPSQTVSATFVGANPRNNLRLGGTFASVEKFDETAGSWNTFRDDADWSLVFEWTRTSTVTGMSEVRISWETEWETGAWRQGGEEGRPPSVEGAHADLLSVRDVDLEGLYRLRYFGDAKSLQGEISAFEGYSAEFKIV